MFGVLLIGVSLRLITMGYPLSDGHTVDWSDFFPIILMGLGGMLSLVVFWAIKGKIALVELRDDSVVIRKNGDRRTVTWRDIAAVSQIQLVQPPLYRLRLRSSEEAILFNTDARYFQALGFTGDLSKMGRLIQKKKHEFRL